MIEENRKDNDVENLATISTGNVKLNMGEYSAGIVKITDNSTVEFSVINVIPWKHYTYTLVAHIGRDTNITFLNGYGSVDDRSVNWKTPGHYIFNLSTLDGGNNVQVSFQKVNNLSYTPGWIWEYNKEQNDTPLSDITPIDGLPLCILNRGSIIDSGAIDISITNNRLITSGTSNYSATFTVWGEMFNSPDVEIKTNLPRTTKNMYSGVFLRISPSGDDRVEVVRESNHTVTIYNVVNNVRHLLGGLVCEMDSPYIPITVKIKSNMLFLTVGDDICIRQISYPTTHTTHGFGFNNMDTENSVIEQSVFNFELYYV